MILDHVARTTRKRLTICLLLVEILAIQGSGFAFPYGDAVNSLRPSSHVLGIGASATMAYTAVQPKYIPRVPSKPMTLTSSEQVNPLECYTSEPAPMGIADYGVGSGGAYSYSTDSFLGSAYIASVSTTTSSRPTSPWMGLQLNVNLVFTNNAALNVYWIQDVVQINSQTLEAEFVDNIWNSGSPTASMRNVALTGNGQIESSSGEYWYYYEPGALPGNYVDLSFPVTIYFRVNSTLTSAGQPQVTFEYSDGFGWQKYDTVTFLTTGAVSLAGFVVNGTTYDPAGLAYDAELIIGGPGNGENAQDVSSNIGLQLQYWNGHNYQSIPSAYNFGCDTAETISNANTAGEYYLSNGTLFSLTQSGSGSLGEIWDRTGVASVNITTATSSGVLSIWNASYVNPIVATYPFSGGAVILTLEPGYYHITDFENGQNVDDGNNTLVAGQQLQLKETPAFIVSYTVVGGGTGYSPPTITYQSNGRAETLNLTTTPTILNADSGSSWSVNAVLGGSTANETWDTSQLTSGVVTVATIDFVYYHQFRVSLLYTVTGGGTGYSQPDITVTQFGASTVVAAGLSAFVDAGSQVTFQSPLPGSTANERWVTQNGTLAVTGSGSLIASYFHQYRLTASYAIAGGGVFTPNLTVTRYGTANVASLTNMPVDYWADSGQPWSAPTVFVAPSGSERWYSPNQTTGVATAAQVILLMYYHQFAVVCSSNVVGGGNPGALMFDFTSLGSPATTPLSGSPSTTWADSGGPYSVSGAVYASSGERWSPLAQATNGTIGSAMTLSISYYHQFFVEVLSNSLAGGTVFPLTGWYNSSEQIELIAVPVTGWRFEEWNATGTSSYQGASSQQGLTVQSPLVENAVFYPGLTISSSSYGSVSYESSTSSGSVGQATNKTLFVPLGSSVQLTASPSLFLFQFDGWSGAFSSRQSEMTATMESPEALRASFSIDWVNISILLAAVLAVVALIVWGAVFRGRSAKGNAELAVERSNPSENDRSEPTPTPSTAPRPS